MSDLIIEDGGGVPGALTWQRNSEIRDAYKMRLGGEAFVNSNDEEFQTKCNVTAADIVSTGNYPGQKLRPDQGLAWPRCGAVDCEGVPLPPCQIPDAVLFAHTRVAVALAAGILLPPGAGNAARVKSLSADGVSMDFANKEGVILHGDGCSGQAVSTNWLEFAGEDIFCLLVRREGAMKILRA